MFTNHKKVVEERFNQLAILNTEIETKTNYIKSLDEDLNRLRTMVESFKSNHPELSEIDAALKELADIKSQIVKAKIELAKIKEEHSRLDDIIDMEMQKEKLQEELASLQKQKDEVRYDPGDVIIVAYTVPKIDDIAIDAFIFDKKMDYRDKISCTGTIYRSLGGGRTIGFSCGFDGALVNDDEPIVNAKPQKFVTFEEACLAIGSDLYLKDTVTAREIHEILMYFRSGFYFYGKTDITLDEFMEMIKTERQDIGSKPLERLLEKGKTE